MSAKVTGGGFSLIDGYTINKSLLSKEEQQNIFEDYSLTSNCSEAINLSVFKSKFSPEIAVRLFDEFQENEVSVCPDCSYMVTFQYELSNWTFNRLLSYGKYVEVIEPEIARTMLKEKALEIAELYD